MSNGLLSGLGSIKRKIFISYHHDSDKAYYDVFINAFSNSYDVIQDNSVDRAVSTCPSH